ncbi:MAG: efflux RND transporter periplasmic adaptor subunit [Proteobacteria bacterium]|nr:efflux RND transporter periplasmic adaptor subunit [Pseudomonadota bacterium]MBU1737769.1 efflux RND transporter periplasmic adaptor subunit [Pseudomonadota bacterium]
MNRMKFIALALCSVVLGLSGCTQPPSEEHKTGMPELPVARVTVVQVAAQQTMSQNEATGTIEAVHQATIASKVTGTIEKLPVDLGSTVKKGDLLLRLSAGEISARAAQAEAQLEQARRNLEREKRLLEKEASTPETVKSMEDGFRVAEAAYREAQTMFGYTTITAPFDGVISGKNIQIGDLATPGTPLLVIENNRKLQVVASVPEELALQIKIGDRLPVRGATAAPDKTGVVSEIAPSSDPQTRTTTVKLKIEDISGLRPGQYVRIVLPGVSVNAYLVPAMAISRYGQMERLFVVENNRAILRLIRTGERVGSQVEILSGIVAGEQVVLHGSNQLVDRQPVEIVQ